MSVRYRWKCATVALLVAALAPAAGALGQGREQRDLAAVRAELESVQARLEREHAARERRYRELKRTEVERARAAESLRGVRDELGVERRRGRELAEGARQAGARLARERDALARQVRMSFLAGREETLKLMLNQQAPARLGRMMTYYEYLNRARSRRIDNVVRDLAELAELAAAADKVQRELAALEAAQRRGLEELERLRAERERAVMDVDAAIESDETQLQRLQGEEQRLAELVRELDAVLAEFPVDSEEPFSKTRGRLAWPVPGTVLTRFGEKRGGPQLRWHGVRLGAPAGTPVRSIYNGRVVYSDWLPGLGLLLIVDHGEGYMSLYGHNEALLKEAGDWVAPGEAIAQVGDSGGRGRTALYFEIRKDGQPVNPRPWMSRADPEPP